MVLKRGDGEGDDETEPAPPVAVESLGRSCSAGRRTFTIGRQGKTALLRDRPVFVAVASGGRYSSGSARQPDFLSPYLIAVLGMIGLRDITVFSVEGTALSPESVADIRAKTERELEAHFSSPASPSPNELAKRRHLSELLDDGLEQTFPASDPVAPFIEEQLSSHRELISET